jgi:hypothetical protein
MLRHFVSVAGLGLAGGLFIVAAGCSAGSEDGQGGSGTGASDSSSTFGQGGSTGTFADGGSSGVGGGCGTSKTAEKVPLDIYVMFDKSGSMDGEKWDSATQAMKAFIAQPGAAGIGVGIQFFPLPSGVTCPTFPVQCASDADCSAGCGPCMLTIPGFGICSGVGNSDSCDVMDYSTPAVEISELPGNAGALTSAIDGATPDGSGTPTLPALDGAIQHASAWAAAHPGHVTIVVLATDGDPNSCSSDVSAIQAVAAAGAAANPPILTFVIGAPGGTAANLNAIAQSGGTNAAYIIGSNATVEAEFLQAMNDIQNKTLPCSYLIPEPPPGETLNLGEVNVTYTPTGGQPTTIPQAAGGLASCMPGTNAWYYDDPANPTAVVLCPDTCATLTADAGTTVSVVFGCATIVQ